MPRTVWQYAGLLIFLLTIASFAAWTTISDLYDNIPGDLYESVKGQEYVKNLDMVTLKIWVLTMGFMLIAGAFGLWAIRFAGEAESQRRVAQIVEGMDYLNDGLMLLDRKGRVLAFNTSLKNIAPTERLKNTLLGNVFPFLTDVDVELLLNVNGPNEVQKDTVGPSGKQAVRFRSQTAGGIRLVFVSDVTTMRTHELQAQHFARFELIGRIARGVTNDFNNILAGISAHASLLSRLPGANPETKNSLTAIIRESERGARLAGHLLEFSRLSVAGRHTDSLGAHVDNASELIRAGLSSGWQVVTEVKSDFPVVPLSGLQIEQVVLNLALVIADSSPRSGTIRITAGRPSKSDQLMDVSGDFAAVIIISSMNAGMSAAGNAKLQTDDRISAEEAGVIQSVVRSLIEESGGRLDFFVGADESRICRIILPYGVIETSAGDEGGELAAELRSYIAHWQVLVARSMRGHDHLDETLRESGVQVERVDNVVSALARIENGPALHAVVFDKDLLGKEAVGLLRAMIKLCPATGLVVLCEDPDRESTELMKDIVFVSRRSESGKIVRTMVEARTLAAQRRHR